MLIAVEDTHFRVVIETSSDGDGKNISIVISLDPNFIVFVYLRASCDKGVAFSFFELNRGMKIEVKGEVALLDAVDCEVEVVFE